MKGPKCSRCGDTNKTNFIVCKGRWNGFSAFCNSCRKLYGKEYYSKNKVKINKRSTKWKRDNPEKYRKAWRRHLLKKYGLTVELVDELLKNQNGLCAICSVEFNDSCQYSVDHNHVTGKVRGLLCNDCNSRLLAGAKVDVVGIGLLNKAIKYIQGVE